MDANVRKDLRQKNRLTYFILASQVNQLADQFLYSAMILIALSHVDLFKGWFHCSKYVQAVTLSRLLCVGGNPKRTDDI